MADEKTKPQAPNRERPRGESPKRPEEASSPEGEKPRKKKSTPRVVKVLMTCLIGTGVVLAEVAVSYIVVTRFIIPQADASTVESGAEEAASTDSASAISRPAATSARRRNAEPDVVVSTSDLPNFNELGGVFTLSDIIINPAYSQGKRFFIASVVIAFESESVAETITNREPILKDRVLLHLGQKSFLWFSNAANMEVLRTELRLIVEAVAGVQEGIHIYFTKYVLQ